MKIRRAVTNDLEQLLSIAAARRETYADYQPQFWRPAADAVDRQRSYFTSLLHDDQAAVVIAAEDGIRGFAIGRLLAAPPVYNPGGSSCMVDDFAVLHSDDWPTVGSLLLDALRSWAAGQAAVQMIVVSAYLDDSKRAALRSFGLDLASEWWVGPAT